MTGELESDRESKPSALARVAPPTSFQKVFRIRNFKLFVAGEAVSLLGDQFFYIGLPWLVLQLTGSGLAVGLVLAVSAIPRAFFMLIGGALTDRLSAHSVLLSSNVARMLLTGVLAALVYTGAVNLPILYVLAFLFGLVDAFFYPASGAIVPQLVEKDDLQPANAVIFGLAQLSLALGPFMAGGLIFLLSGESAVHAGASPGLMGIALVLAVDTATFLVSIITLWMMRIPASQTSEIEAEHGRSQFLESIRAGLVLVWKDRTLRALFFIIAILNLSFTGPIAVGVPVLADLQLPEGAGAYGIIMSAFGVGSLLGTIAAGALPRPSPRILGVLLITLLIPLGSGIICLGFVKVTLIAAAIAFGMGMANGYVTVSFVTWIQRRTPVSLLGRMMSVVMFASVGLQPFSMAIAGFVIGWNPTALFVGAGVVMIVLALVSLSNPHVRNMGLEKPAQTRTVGPSEFRA